jgi:hypothetical protein
VVPILYLEPRQLRRVNREFVAFVRSKFPMRFYGGEKMWSVYAAAALLRMCDTVEAMMFLLARRKDGESLVLLRALYEQMVRFAWVAIDPAERHANWAGDSHRQMLKLHNAVAKYGHGFLSDEEIVTCETAQQLPSIEQMAREADQHWSRTITGLHDAGEPLSFEGLYNLIYRFLCRPTHADLNALGPYITENTTRRGARFTVHEERPGELLNYSLAAPMLAIALLVGAQHFRWLDVEQVRRFVNRATAETIRNREAGEG